MKKITRAAQQDLGRHGTPWRKSSYSYSEGACVEMAQPSETQVFIRDSKIHNGPVMRVSGKAAAAFTSAVGHGRL
ncbi:DUF397 domain-containing protein [Streptomyces sp. LP11]|uniref:DUF397 domain-containing protein n=1 Tax=Streptomyces pyxinicus TaxID=2970331 RepID=A0ABT2AW59_9ACTN|nr:DUF397 domain-containing protein [Streptomyces sp. LP11]MCS0600488.1 DUF397 domain-containing protein [Streptomyces sp. LP11]